MFPGFSFGEEVTAEWGSQQVECREEERKARKREKRRRVIQQSTEKRSKTVILPMNHDVCVFSEQPK